LAGRKKIKQKAIGEMQCEYCRPCVSPPYKCYLTGSLLAVTGLLGLAGYFGILDLSPLNWNLLWPISVLVIGLTELFGITC